MVSPLGPEPSGSTGEWHLADASVTLIPLYCQRVTVRDRLTNIVSTLCRKGQHVQKNCRSPPPSPAWSCTLEPSRNPLAKRFRSATLASPFPSPPWTHFSP